MRPRTNLRLFATLYGRLACSLMVVFIAIGAVMIVASQRMFETQRLFELVTNLVVGTVAFSLIAALVVFRFLTLRLRRLASAIEAFRASGFASPMRAEAPDGNDDEIGCIIAAFQEMSERIAMQLAQLAQADRQRRELLANVSHDLRTPLASMQGYLEMVLIKDDGLSQEDRCRYLQIAVKHCERLARLVRDLFDLTKLEANEVRPQVEPFPISELAQDVVQKFALSAQKRDLKLSASVSTDCPPVCADIGMMERVLENLIENAMRYTPAGGEISVGVRRAGDRVELQVSDTGQGIDHDDIGNVFDRYYRADRGESSDAGNAGLGLAITRRIIELHGGQIRVESAPGAGTTFTVELAMA
ncbi:sensor histidine kinase [Paraburkholderia franconis]|uniref:sensor histidine kinase n=1 Tax=Paraburkholderia franconis TaxID=2654983 RepID=UPI001D11A324|nr:ATP-binding protein [Paraburkholderia franconis]